MSIKSRAVIYSVDSNGRYHFPGWAVTTTTLGTMAEPFMPNYRSAPGCGMNDFDYSNMMTRIDELRNVPHGGEWRAVSFDTHNPVIHGGEMMPRTDLRESLPRRRR